MTSPTAPPPPVAARRPLVVFFSNKSENTARFVAKLDTRALRIPLEGPMPMVREPYVLVVPTYKSGRGTRVAPVQVAEFLQDVEHRTELLAVVAAGNTNFGADYCKAGSVISEKFGVPLLHRFELMGLPEDVRIVTEHLDALATAREDIDPLPA